ncbi:TolC family protein [Leeuwenhoekiella marinoflava]|uniref:TolC family protein n=1 Tax=Leeuwenhoekiella marinoflava TaxID=988 RepID=UPI003003188F
MFYRLFLVVLLGVSFLKLNAQEQSKSLNLEQSIALALANNLDLKTADLNAETETIRYKQSRNALLPGLNADYNLGLSNGRSIDPFTNAYVNEQLTYSNAGLSLSATVFNGFRLLNTLKQSSLDKAAAVMEHKEAQQNLILDVTLAFLQVLNSRELLKLAQSRVLTSQEQLQRLAKMQEEETGDPAAYRDLQGQVATDEASVAEAHNNLKNAVTSLETLLNANVNINADELTLLLDFQEREDTAAAIYEEALLNLASVRAKELRLEAATKGVAVARSQYSPEIRVFANLGTNYSSAARVFDDAGTQLKQTGDFVTVSGTEYSVFTEENLFDASTISYTDQFNNNLNSTAGVSVSIPLFNGFQAKNAVQLQKIEKDQAKLNLEQTKISLKQNIQQAYNDTEAAYIRLTKLTEQEAAFEDSFRINETRFNLGVSTSVEYLISKNKLDNARINLTTVKYEYVLRNKVLEYYKGGVN